MSFFKTAIKFFGFSLHSHFIRFTLLFVSVFEILSKFVDLIVRYSTPKLFRHMNCPNGLGRGADNLFFWLLDLELVQVCFKYRRILTGFRHTYGLLFTTFLNWQEIHSVLPWGPWILANYIRCSHLFSDLVIYLLVC